MSVDLPKKHGRGGQSALRFARLRMEKRHNYVRKVAELAVQVRHGTARPLWGRLWCRLWSGQRFVMRGCSGHQKRLRPTYLSSFPRTPSLPLQFFITNDRPNVAGLVLAGSADFKTELSQSDMFDPRLQAVVLAVVDVSYGERGGAGRGRVGEGWAVACIWCIVSGGCTVLSHARVPYQFPAGGAPPRIWQLIKWRPPHSSPPAAWSHNLRAAPQHRPASLAEALSS